MEKNNEKVCNKCEMKSTDSKACHMHEKECPKDCKHGKKCTNCSDCKDSPVCEME